MVIMLLELVGLELHEVFTVATSSPVRLCFP